MAALPAVLAGQGCYQYQPAALSALHPGQQVHVTLTPAGSSALSSSLGANAATLDGRVVSATGSDLTLSLSQIARTAGPEQFLNNEPVTFARENASAVTVRAFDAPRTALAVGGIVAAVVVGQVFINQSGIFSSKGTVSSSTK